MDLALGFGVGAIVAVGLVVFFLLGRARSGAPAVAPTAPSPTPAEPLAMQPVTLDPLDAPEPSHLGEPPPPGLEVAPRLAASLPESSTLREHHRSASGHLRILFAKEMKPAATDETDPDDEPIA